jgi:hypothetical protein
MAGERDVDNPGKFQDAASSQLVLLKTGFEKDHHGWSPVRGGWHPSGMVHDDATAS